MKIMVSASSTELSSPIDPRFGRCTYFLFVDSENMQFEAIENPNITSSSGAGIQSAQLVADKGANVLLTGSCGPYALQTLKTAGVEVIVGVTGTVQEAVQQYKSGKLQLATQSNVSSPFGMGMGMGMGGGSLTGLGSGMGRGMGCGRGGGMGRGMGRGMGYGVQPQIPGMPSSSPEAQVSPEEELQYLKQQAGFLRQEMENITKRIEELKKKSK